MRMPIAHISLGGCLADATEAQDAAHFARQGSIVGVLIEFASCQGGMFYQQAFAAASVIARPCSAIGSA